MISPEWFGSWGLAGREFQARLGGRQAVPNVSALSAAGHGSSHLNRRVRRLLGVSDVPRLSTGRPLLLLICLLGTMTLVAAAAPPRTFTRENAGGEMWGIDPLVPDNIGPARVFDRQPCRTDDRGIARCLVECDDIRDYQIHTIPDGYDVVQFESVTLKTTPGGQVEHTFKLRPESAARTREEPVSERSDVVSESVQEPQPANRVVDMQGRPVSGARVTLRTSYRLDNGRLLGETVADANGRFSYPAAAAANDRFYVHASADGFRDRYWLGNRVVYRMEEGVRHPDTLTLFRPVTVAGRILDEAGRPLSGAEIAVDYFIKDGPANINGTRVTSDADGRFRATGLPPANLFVRYESPYDEEHPRMPVGTQSARLCIAHFKAEDGQVIDDVVLDLRTCRCVVEGSIVDEHDAGVAGRWIQATLTAASGRLDESVTVKTDDQGRFRFEGLSPDEFSIGTYTPGFRRNVRPATDSPTTVRLTTYVSGHEPPPDRKAEPVWGEPDKRKLVTGLQFDPHPDALDTGRTVRVSVVLRNTAETTQIVRYTFSKHAELRVLDGQDKRIAELNYANFRGLPVPKVYRLAPGHEVVVGSFSLAFTATDSGTSPPAGATFTVPAVPGDRLTLYCELAADTFGQREEGAPVLPRTGRSELRIATRD